MSGEEVKSYVKCFIKTNRLHRRVFELSVNETGVHRSQHQLLMHISVNEGSSQKEIAEAMGVSTATIAVTLKKLEKAGFVQKAMKLSDNRVNRVALTEKGKLIIQDSQRIIQELDEAFFEGFQKEEMDQLMNYLMRMQDNMLEYANKKGYAENLIHHCAPDKTKEGEKE